MPKQRHKHLSPTAILFLLSTIFAAFLRHVSADDGQAMAMLAKSIIPTPSGWTGSNYCDWQGVSCDSSGQVISINLSSKSLSGTIATEINQLASLKSLSLQRNHFSGPVPALSNLGSLEQVNLDDNSFDSLHKDFLSGLTSLQFFTMNNNTNLPPWRIPDSLSDSTSLTSFSASSSNIMGEIPDVFGSLPNFLSLRLSYNNLTGSLPGSFANSGIQNLTLNNQGSGLSGMIDVLASMTQLRVVWLHSNSFTGQIPDLSACKELSDLLLRDNSLTGVIPDSFTKLPNLKNVALQHNKFQGPMPSFPPGIQVNLGTTNNFCLPSPGPCSPEVNALLEAAREMKYPMTLAEDWTGNNPCQQWQFITCEDGRVTIINFARQNWTGTISPAYANLTELKSLLLNDNKLEGTIPQSLTTLKYLRILDVSNNNISGKVPAFASSVTVRVSGNANIGKDIPLSGPGRGPSSAENGASGKDGQGKTSFPAAAIIALVAVFFIAGAVSGFFITSMRGEMSSSQLKFSVKQQTISVKSTY